MEDWKAIAYDNGITRRLFNERVRGGWSEEKAATCPPMRNRHGKNGEWVKKAERNGISRSMFYHRVNKLGWDYKEAATHPTAKKVKRSDAKWLKVAKGNDIPGSVYRARVDCLKWDHKEAATTPILSAKEVGKRNGDRQRREALKRYEQIDNDPDNLFELTPRLIKIAEQNGIAEKTARARVDRLGWTVDEAISIPVKTRNPSEEDRKWIKVASQNGINGNAFRARVARGWPVEKAATTPLISKRHRSVHCQQSIEKAKQIGVSEKAYVWRVEAGWTKEEAATTPMLKKGEFLNEERKRNSVNALRNFNSRKVW